MRTLLRKEKGTKKISGADVIATDLRGGASLVLAGLVAKGKTNTHICVLNSKTDKTCKEIELCENVIFTGTTATDEVCSSYHVKLSNTRTHYCVKKEDLTGCKEQDSL